MNLKLDEKKNGSFAVKYTYSVETPYRYVIELIKYKPEDMSNGDAIKMTSFGSVFAPEIKWQRAYDSEPRINFEKYPLIPLSEIGEIYQAMTAGKEIIEYCIEHFNELCSA